ncbi:DUF4097 family beta strand repeat-containing protein [Pediococcus parvulus]|uniref:hypothetical protein n=1 Tax=Pediococcus parvulus TaxID=54062 RepID=UPI003D01DDB2
MKKIIKVGSLSLLIGLFLSLVGWKMNGFQSMTIDQHYLPRIVKIEKKTTNLSSFTSIKGDINNYNVHIKTGKNYKIHYQGQSQANPIYRIKNNQLIIKQTGKLYNAVVHKSYVPNVLTITVPKNSNLNQLDWKITGDNLTLEHLNIKQVKLRIKNGYFWAYNSTLGQTDFNSFGKFAGNVSLHQVKLLNGASFKQEGAFRMFGGSFKGIVKIYNSGYFNHLYGLSKKDGYTLKTGSSDAYNNWYGFKTTKTITKNPHSKNQIELYNKYFENVVDHQ